MVLVLARDREHSKVVFSYASAILKVVPALKRMIIRQTADEIDLENGPTIAVKIFRLPGGARRHYCLRHRRRGGVLGLPGGQSGQEIFQALGSGHGDDSGGEAPGLREVRRLVRGSPALLSGRRCTGLGLAGGHANHEPEHHQRVQTSRDPERSGRGEVQVARAVSGRYRSGVQSGVRRGVR
jgi:hypothetical protein